MLPQKEVSSHKDQVAKWCDARTGKPKVWVTMLYGSQNYGLDSPESDVDTKTMLLPSLQMVLMDQDRVSTEIKMADGSLDNCKDVREMFGNYLKGNINFVETLYTPYYACIRYQEMFEELRANRNVVANAQPRRLMHMAAGMAKQKYCAFSHPYEGKKEVLAEHGYDPKQLHHLVRLYYFMKTYYETNSFYHALNCASYGHNPGLHDYLMKLKLKPYHLNYASELREEFMQKVDKLVEVADKEMPENQSYKEAKEFLDDFVVRLLKMHLKRELFEY